MKKCFRTIMALAMLVTTSMPMVACGGGEVTSGSDSSSAPVDNSKTQIYVSNFDGGFGTEWLYNAIERFEDLYKETSFEDDKVGVQFHVDPNKNQGNAVSELIKGSDTAIYFTQGVDYYSYVNDGLAADITDIVTGDLSEFGDNKTIESKMNEQQKNFYKTSEGKYYAIPHYAGYDGIQYDVDLFEKKNFYFAADTSVDANTTKYNTALNNGNNGFIYDKNDVKSNGPDGKPNTYDDGLPATYDEMFLLCDYIVGAGCTPFIWSGQFRWDYIKGFIASLAVDYEGHDQMMLHYTFDGTAEHLVKSIDNNGKVTFEEPTMITSENGYELYKSAGKYYGLYFYQTITSNSAYYHSKSFSDTQSHLLAHQDFLFSRPEAKKPIAMMTEGSYWVNESKQVFEDIAGQYGDAYSMNNRKLAIMPTPKVSVDQVGEKYTVMDGLNSVGFINANCKGAQLDVAKKFLQFVNTDESLRAFTTTTNSPKSLSYELTDGDLASMSYYGRQLWNIKKTVDIVYPFSTNLKYMNNQSKLSFGVNFDSKIGSTVRNYVADELRGTSSNKVSAKDYFLGIQKQYDAVWWESLN